MCIYIQNMSIRIYTKTHKGLRMHADKHSQSLTLLSLAKQVYKPKVIDGGQLLTV